MRTIHAHDSCARFTHTTHVHAIRVDEPHVDGDVDRGLTAAPFEIADRQNSPTIAKPPLP